MSSIKGIIFDYGGTLDTNGLHWGMVIWSAYQQERVVVGFEHFQEAYNFAERQMALQPVIRAEFNFLEVLQAKLRVQFGFLKEAGYDLDLSAADRIAQRGYALAARTVKEVAPLLNKLADEYPLVVVSNFYGNLQAVLKDFGILTVFQDVVESAVVGTRKPFPKIYELGVEAMGLMANEVVVIGDSYSKDMVPAKSVGCQTIWLSGQGWQEGEMTDISAADRQISSIFELSMLLL